VEKAYLCEVDNPGRRVTFQFNPTAIKFSKTAQYKRQENQKAKKGPAVQFVSTGPTELSLQLVLDGVGQGAGRAVDGEVNQLAGWLAPTDSSARSSSPSPPLLQFTWGQLKLGTAGVFQGHLESLSVNYKLFTPQGVPIRAEVDLKLKDVPATPSGTNPTSGALRTFRRRQLTRGETLHSVAYDEYGEASLWRDLARVNGIDDPLRIAPGLDLLIPEEEELRRDLADAG
jgi:nucleoid-associated protein YgaU